MSDSIGRWFPNFTGGGEPPEDDTIIVGTARTLVIRGHVSGFLRSRSAHEQTLASSVLHTVAESPNIGGIRLQEGAWSKFARLLELNGLRIGYFEKEDWLIFHISFVSPNGGGEPLQPSPLIRDNTNPGAQAPSRPRLPADGAPVRVAEAAESSWVNGRLRSLALIGGAADYFERLPSDQQALTREALQDFVDDNRYVGEVVQRPGLGSSALRVTIRGVTIVYVDMPEPMLVVDLSFDDRDGDGIGNGMPQSAGTRTVAQSAAASAASAPFAGAELNFVLAAVAGDSTVGSTPQHGRAAAWRQKRWSLDVLRRQIWTRDLSALLAALRRQVSAGERSRAATMSPVRVRVSVPAPWGSDALVDWLDAAIDVQELPGSPWLPVDGSSRRAAARALAQRSGSCLAAFEVVLDESAGVRLTAKMLTAAPAGDGAALVHGQVWSVETRGWPAGLPLDVSTAAKLVIQNLGRGGLDAQATAGPGAKVHAVGIVALAILGGRGGRIGRSLISK